MTAFLAAWISCFIFEGPPSGGVNVAAFPLAALLVTRTCLPLAPLFIGTFYWQLDLLKEWLARSMGRYDITSYVPTPFLHIFFYESYPSVAPVLIQYIEPPSGSAGECVTSHWFKLSSLEMLSSIVDSKTEFVWRPYVAPKAGVEYS